MNKASLFAVISSEPSTRVGKVKKKKRKKKYRFEFTMRDSIKDHYRALHAQEGGIYMPDVTMIRDGESRGYPFVEPWLVDILFVPGRHFPMCAILS